MGPECRSIFSHLLALMYSDDRDGVYICGDMNSHITDLKDYVLSRRHFVLDMGGNKHEEAF